jgi:ATP-dependent Lon protease
LGQSIAHALGRKFIRMSLGGIRDEATIRGHRRTYVGAMPGRIMREIRRAESNNPLFMLDEIDKIGQDLRGDPMSALLEVLDPAQNAAFSDHYLGVPFDLSHVMFITTANYMYAIEPALRDRMEIIEIDGYTQREKIKIAEHHLIPRQLEQNGLSPELIHFDADVLAVIVSDYTREAGVRELERKIGAVCRARATAVVRGEKSKRNITVTQLRTILGNREYESEVAAAIPAPGVVTGLAFTAVGGEILFIEAAAVPGNGQLKLTGQLGDVMRESAMAASTIIQSRLGKASQNESVTDAQSDFHQLDIHVHVPAGATPKDGPSAGVAMLAAMASALTGECVDPATGMTGEITLSGRVLPVGGIREKVLAAFRAGLKRVIIPARNKQDLDEVPEDVRENIDFVFVKTIDQVLNTVFGGRTRKRPAKHKAAKRKVTKGKVAKRNVPKRKAAKPPTKKLKS